MENNATPAERAFRAGLETPVPLELRAALHKAARHQIAVRARRRRVAWFAVPTAAAAAVMLMLSLLNRPTPAPAPVHAAAPPTFHHHARNLVALAAGGNTYHEEADMESLASDLLSLQGF